MKKLLVTSALPYSNGPIHIGHIAGAYLPADIFVRYQKLCKNDVVFICGTDENGAAITIAALKQKVSPQALVDKYYELNKESFEKLGIIFDNFSRTSRQIHHKTAQDFFVKLNEKGLLNKKETQQLYCKVDNMFLADRYVSGTCPNCEYDDARGDQCEKCGSALDPLSLKGPRCSICGKEPEIKSTSHWYLPLGKFQPELEEWLGKKKDWKDNVMNYCKGWFKEGLRDRAITRDLEWGVPVPVPDAQGKVMYVWFEAPIGYISSTKEWAEEKGNPDLWKDYWLNPECELIHFIGKDNIVFHAIFWPATLMGVREFNLPTQIPANEFLNLEGRKISTSKNFAVWVPDYLKNWDPDILRYTLAANLPESKDADFSWRLFQKCNNGELADILGNFINRTLTFISKRLDNTIPEAVKTEMADSDFIEEIKQLADEAGALIDTYKIRAATHKIMDIARAANRYFDSSEPWKTRKTNPEKCQTTLHYCCLAIRTLAICFYPVIPFTCDKIWSMMGFDAKVSDSNWSDAVSDVNIEGTELGNIEILFQKIEEEDIQAEIEKLGL